MPDFEPNSIIQIGRVPFDSSYRHTMTFASASAQEAYFAGVCTQSLSRSDYTYVRQRNSIKVPFNAEQLYTYNYVMYKNANYGNKWFYAFIVGCNYLNDNATELVFELDVMQTWYFDYTLEECFVEREHVSDDAIGLHTNPEPEMPFNLTSNGRYTNQDLWDSWLVVQTNAVPHYSEDTTVPNGSDAVVGGWYQRCFSGSKYYAFDLKDGDHSANAGIFYFLKNMNRAGAAESISNIFLFPKTFSPSRGTDYGLQEDTIPLVQNFSTTRPTSLDGYVPRNNKLFTWPYCFCRFTDNNGGVVELKYELWTQTGSQFWYTMEAALDPDAKCVVAPKGYAGVLNSNYENALSFPITTKCSWNYSSYQTWSAQNALGNAITFMTNAAMVAIPAARGIGAAAKVLGASAAPRAAGALASRGAMLFNPYEVALGKGLQTAASGWGGLSIGAGALGLTNLASEVSRQSRVPDVMKGQTSNNTMYSLRMQTYNIDQMSVTAEYAAIIDGFFDMYGYQVDSVKVPNRTGRANWNYVKCQNSCNRGNVPADDMARINAIYDSGITFWHTSDVGNYSLANGIV